MSGAQKRLPELGASRGKRAAESTVSIPPVSITWSNVVPAPAVVSADNATTK
jgi:hypothetical protein